MAVDTPYAPLRQAGEADQQAVVDVLTEAFTDDPVVRWLFPGLAERGRLQERYYRALITRPTVETYLVGDRDGAAVWLTVAAGETPHEEHPDVDLTAIFGEGGARLRALGQALAGRYPDREPHRYLSCMGVVGARQGAGLGSAMLRHGLTRAEGLPVYLEASSPRSRALYARHGFEDLGEPVQVADSPLLWPMWHRPETQGKETR
ncbi:GNAT family N-acetyltransferase [Actinophytocola sp.]|uniref:GNAT family N-acetyltransferase n=1 Tax=Actinophytocola sp. TaxID=1872138 RepID=UPI002ECFFCCE